MHRLLQSCVEGLRGNLQPWGVASAMVLGLLAGLVTGWNLSLVAVLMVVLLLNVPLRLFVQAWLSGVLLSWVLAPVTYALGRLLLEKSPLGRALAPAADQPWLLLFELDRFTVIGGLAAAALIALPVAWIAARTARSLEGRYRGWQEALAAGTPLETAFPAHLACWLIFGEPPCMATVPARRLFRPRGLTMLLALGLTLSLLSGWYGPRLVSQKMLLALSVANHAEVNAASLQVSPVQGWLEITDLQIADPQQLDRDRLRIGAVTAQLSPGGLLRGRVHIQRLLLHDVRGDAARASRARPFGLSVPKFETLAVDTAPRGLGGADARSLALDECLGQWPALRTRLSHLQQLIEQVENLAALGSKPMQPQPGQPKHREVYCDFGRLLPDVHIDQLSVNGLAPDWGLGSQGSIEMVHLSSHPKLTNQRAQLALRVVEPAMELIVTMQPNPKDARHELRLRSSAVELGGLLQTRPGLAIRHGALTIEGHGWCNSREFELAVKLAARRLEAQMTGERKFAGLSADHWNQGLERLGGLHTDGTLFGRWTAPRLLIQPHHLLSDFKHQLREAGEQALVAAIDKSLAAQSAGDAIGLRGDAAPLAAVPVQALPSQALPAADVAENRAMQALGDPFAAVARQAEVAAKLQADDPEVSTQPAARGASADAEPSQSAVAIDHYGSAPSAVPPNAVRPGSVPAISKAEASAQPPGPAAEAATGPRHLISALSQRAAPAQMPAATSSVLPAESASPPAALPPNPGSISSKPASLLYPESLRAPGMEGESVLADLAEMPAVERADEPAGQPLATGETTQKKGADPQAASSLSGPPPSAIGMEMGYDEPHRGVRQATAVVPPLMATQPRSAALAGPSTAPFYRGSAAPANLPTGENAAPSEGEQSKLKSWSKGVSNRMGAVGNKMKNLVPWRKKSGDVENAAGDESELAAVGPPPLSVQAKSRSQANASHRNQPASIPGERYEAGSEADAQPKSWYQRMWR